ncbi:hypothetical protein JJV70_07065 [Streptomyces sp. JJ66]|uniref:hypothetical protein n=1 Tax=Streptomyces sp. JJ66 TaxID=2803843 RepID=UPI001C5699D0|nr:hypothetical protein [Streptomyces sp. JJ66]MBW1601873.1 hypothetical protein [Streptomyces sp. JJ66]
MALKFEDVLHARLSRLADAVDDWSTVVTKFGELAEESRTVLKARSDAARWEGANAAVTRPFVDKTAGEFNDAENQAVSIRNILRDGHSDLTTAKNDLQKLMDNLPDGVTVYPNGVVARSVHPDRRSADNTDPGPTQATLEDVRDQIAEIVGRAAETDARVARALKDVIAGHPYDFSGTRYESLDEWHEEQSVEDAEVAAELFAKGHEMTDEELERFNKYLDDNRDNPTFAEHFATQQSAEDLMELYVAMADNRLNGGIDEDRRAQLAAMQENLSHVLGIATQTDTPEIRRWEEDVIELGPTVLDPEGHTSVYGFQVMSNLMRHGEFDTEFLQNYGNALFATEKEMGIPGNYWNGPLAHDVNLNFAEPEGHGEDASPADEERDPDFGRDPMTGFLMALGRNPEAATEFFSADHPHDNSAYILAEREYFQDSLPGTPMASREAAAAALYAAGSGINAYDPDATYVPHTDAHREILRDSLDHLSQQGDDFPPEMREGMAHLLANHGDEVHESASALGKTSSPLDRSQLLEVFKQVSRDQDGHAILNLGMNAEIMRDIEANEVDHPKETLLRGGKTIGFLEQAKQMAIETDKRDPSWHAKWGYHVFGAVVNEIPILGDVAQRGVDLATYSWQLDQQEAVKAEATEEGQKAFFTRESQLNRMAEIWTARNPGVDEGQFEIAQQAHEAAFSGNDTAKALAS